MTKSEGQNPKEIPMTKILFLDIDGVLNRCGATPKDARGLEEPKVGLLEWILQRTGARVVLSSTWRKADHLLQRISAVLASRGHPILDCTPVLDGQPAPGSLLYTSVPRGSEIQAWLNDNPEVARFVILDDDADMGPLLPHLVNTYSFTGLTPEIATECVARLNAA